MTLSVRDAVWKIYLAVAITTICGHFWSPDDPWIQTGWLVAIALSGSVAILAGLRLHRPPAWGAWVFVVAGLVPNALGNLVETFVDQVLHLETFPSVADAFYLALYPGLAVGLALLIRARTGRHDWTTLVDTATISTGLGLVCWVFLIRTVMSDSTLGLLGHTVSVAYPVGDVVLIAMLVRLVFAGDVRLVSFWMLAASLLFFLTGDVSWAGINQTDAVPPTLIAHLLDACFLLGYVLPGVAALHPSVRELGKRAPRRQTHLNPILLVLLTATSLIAPGILALEAAQGEITDGVAIAIGCVSLFLLVVTRMAQLLRQVEAQAKELEGLALLDDLTGLPNRRALFYELPRAMERARRSGSSLSVAMLDLDYFKRFNDEFGHPAGDRLLKSAAAAWRDNLRAVDDLARYGGEEFCLVLPGASSDEAAELVERLRGVTPGGQTFSAGLATWDGEEPADALLARADGALYEAKRAGRDRVIPAAA